MRGARGPLLASLLSLVQLVCGCGENGGRGGDGGLPQARAECSRGSPGAFPGGGVIELEDVVPPCEVQFRKTGVRLMPTEDGSRPDPGFIVAMDGRGRFYSTDARGWAGVVAVWDERGDYLTSFGREGEGPGEFRGRMGLYVDRDDRLYVNDGQDWSIFSPEHDFLGRASLPGFWESWDQKYMVVLDDGMILSGGFGGGGHHFRVGDPREGRSLRTFGPLERDASAYPGEPNRSVAYAGGTTFWAGPADGDPNGYVLEERTLDGELRRAIRRRAPWYEAGGSHETAPRTTVHLDDGGLLYVRIDIVSEEAHEAIMDYMEERAATGVDDEELAEVVFEETEIVVEIIDTRSGRLLASDHRQTAAALRAGIPLGLFHASMLGYSPVLGDEGLRFVEIVEVSLAAK